MDSNTISQQHLTFKGVKLKNDRQFNPLLKPLNENETGAIFFFG